MTKNKEVNYKGYDCEVIITKYQDYGNPAILFHEKGTGTLVADASVNLGYKLDEGTVAIKTWSENEGILEFLVREGIVAETLYTSPTGYTQAHICRLLVPGE